MRTGNFKQPRDISIHAPRVGSDLRCIALSALKIGFLSTLPAWGATRAGELECGLVSHFYPRSPRGERLAAPAQQLLFQLDFYPRSPRGERLVMSFGI